MAEAATVIALIEFSAKVLKYSYEYISKAKNAPNGIQSVIDEISSLKGILENLKPFAEDQTDERFVLLKSLNRSNGSFQACSKGLEELERKLRALTEASNVRRRMLWPLEAKKIDEVLQKLGAHKTNFILALAGDNAASNLVVEGAISDIKGSLVDMQAREEQNRILEWLKGADPTTNHHAALKKKESGTCEWLLRSEQFQKFASGEGQLMWLHGIPGAGKTVLSSAVIEHLLSSPTKVGRNVVYYYFDFNNRGKQTALGCLQSFVYQFCQQSGGTSPEILKLYQDCNGAGPNLQQLTETLTQLFSQDSPVFVIIDALDECKQEDGEEERVLVLEALREIKTSTSAALNIFVASRPEADITREMEALCDINLDVQSALVDEDIRCHIRSCLGTDARLKRWPDSVKKEIEDKLTNDANGMFRWVACQLSELRKCLKLPNIRKELNNLPKTLDATYARILNNVSSLYERELKTVLMLLAFSARPMTIQEVAEATAINLDIKKFTVDERFPDAYDILEFCSSLVSVSELPDDGHREGHHNSRQPRPEVRVLQFAHFSVKEYILSDRARKSLSQALLINEELGKKFLAQVSLIYLLDFNNLGDASRFDYDEFPFLAYSALYWITHLAADAYVQEDAVEKFLLKFFDPESETNIIHYLDLEDDDRCKLFEKPKKKPTTSGFRKKKQNYGPPMLYAQYQGLIPVLKYLFQYDGKGSLTREVLGSALATAANDGYEDIVELLLREGADPNSPYCGQLLRPLLAAASSGNAIVVKQLLNAGASVNIHGGDEGNALHKAIKSGNTEIIQLLIDYGHDLYTSSPRHGPPLSCALLKGKAQAKVVAVLLHNKVDVNIPPAGYFNPLNLAGSKADLETVRLLLDNGADTTLKLPGSQALHNAARRGEIDIMQLLVDRGAEINGTSDATYGTPLKASIQSHKDEAFEFTLSHGADINCKGSRRKYPLDQAIFSGNMKAAERLIEMNAKFGDEALEKALYSTSKEYLAKMLLGRGADPNADHHRYGTILQFTAFKGSVQGVRWLLEAGSDPNDVPGGEYGTALQAACCRGRQEIVEILLEYGASVNPRFSGKFGYPLQAAINDGDEKIIHLVLDAGASVTAQGGNLGTPLQAAAAKGFVDISKLLVSQGADVNAPICGEYGTALHAALAQDHEKVVEFLLQQNADINLDIKANHTTAGLGGLIEQYRFSIEVAAASANTRLVQLLLDQGLDLNSNGEACMLALDRASDLLDISMLQFLIHKGANVKKYGALALVQNINRHDPNRIEKVRLLLKHGAHASGDPTVSKRTPLTAAIQGNPREVVNLLLEAGADVNVKHSGANGSALHQAIDQVAIDVVEELIRRGADVNIRAGQWGTPLTTAINKGEDSLYKLLLKHGAKVNPDPPYGYWGTPLHAAIRRDDYEITYDLLDRGADPHVPGLHANALTTACEWGNVGQLDLVKNLISLGVDVNAEDIRRPEKDQIYRNSRLGTPLTSAVFSGNEEVVQLLLNNGAHINPSPPTSTFGNPLQAAVKNHDEQMIKYLLKRGADVNAVGGELGTALQAAASEASDSIVKLLLDAGADVKLEGGSYGSPLQATARIGKKRDVLLFLSLGAPVNTNVGKYGNPLAAAAKRADGETIEILLQHGANPNQKGGKYGTPLQAACCASSSTANSEEGSVVRLLLEHGADVDARGGKYGSAIQAAAYHDRRYVEMLLNAGADPNSEGGKFGSAIRAARKKGFGRVEKLLLGAGAKDEEVEVEKVGLKRIV
ncbi:ankyrin repeat-containing domain protein [Cadophora sp. MPI-SDFR-AT-0126]|nr:ankyrin repeat-containing domain protein [Leotiomycetes sp. MPI-SDFR-AT-0126]